MYLYKTETKTFMKDPIPIFRLPNTIFLYFLHTSSSINTIYSLYQVNFIPSFSLSLSELLISSTSSAKKKKMHIKNKNYSPLDDQSPTTPI